MSIFGIRKKVWWKPWTWTRRYTHRYYKDLSQENIEAMIDTVMEQQRADMMSTIEDVFLHGLNRVGRQ